MNRLNLVKNFKAYTLRMKDRRSHNYSLLKAYLRKQKAIVVQNTQRRMIRGIFWIGAISLSYYFAHKVYSQKLEVQQMQKKLTKLYPNIVKKVPTQRQSEIYYVKPEYDDQLANIIEMCWKYHFKVIINSAPIDQVYLTEEIEKFITDIPEKITEKCLIVNLSKLKKIDIDYINGTVKVQSGITCKELNQNLKLLGYEQIFPEQLSNNPSETVYDAISNNYPTNSGSISQLIVNLDIISPQGQYFRSSNQNNQYGATPNLNNIFVGTGGIFGIPLRINFKITPIKKVSNVEKNFKINCTDLNQKLLITRKIKQFLSVYGQLVKSQFYNTKNEQIQLKLKSNRITQNIFNDFITQLRKQIPDLDQQNTKISTMTEKNDFNIYFNTSQIGYEKFLVFKSKYPEQNLNYSYSQNLLKVNCQKEPLLYELISDLCSENTVLVWSKDHKFLKSIKKTTDQSQVGSELMKILVQIREGIDHKKIYYSHNRYEEYFAKGSFRKLTEIFW